MQLPFSESEFLDVFGAYNTALWPAVFGLWIASGFVFVRLLGGTKLGRGLTLLLALHWAWAGVAYHLGFFASINPAARLFGALFSVQAALFAKDVLSRTRSSYAWEYTPRRVSGALLCGYSLVYPILAAWLVEPYPRTPTFGVPCPTTLFTVGVLMMANRVRLHLLVIPTLWSLIGGSAAILFGVPTDYVLLATGVFLTVYLLADLSKRLRNAV